MWYKAAFLGSPGTGKSLCGLSFPGVEHHVWGSSEETSALNFVGRTDILPLVKFDWYDMLDEKEKAKLTDEKAGEDEITLLIKRAKARNVIRYRRYLYRLKEDLRSGKRPELKTVFLDNLTPFTLEFEDYIEVVYGKEMVTKEGNFDTISYYKRYGAELIDFIRLFMSLECHSVFSVHVSMVASEEVGANTQFMTVAKMGGVKKEWQPLISGKTRFALAGIPDWVFFLKAVENPGQATKYVAKLEADESNVGVAKPRVQPFENPREIYFPKCHTFEFFDSAIQSYLKTGKPVPSK